MQAIGQFRHRSEKILVSDRIFGSIWKYNCGLVLTHHYTYQTLILINLKIRNLYSNDRVQSITFDILNSLTIHHFKLLHLK